MLEADLVVVGAGPAGMAAAACAAEAGAQVVLIDEQPDPGGQIYRAVEAAADRRGTILGRDYLAGLGLVRALRASRSEHIGDATVWDIAEDLTVAFSCGGEGRRIRAGRIILATGALERPVPVPGWTLPGVMTAGAAQILLKCSGVVPRGAVVAGSGPLLYLLARQLIAAGHPPLALVETQTRQDLHRGLRHLPAALGGWRYLVKGAAMLAAIRRAGIPRHTGAHDLRIEGEDAAAALSFAAGGRRHRIACRTILLHQGVVPNIQITRALRLDHVWDAHQRAFRPATDAWFRTSRPEIHVAGDGAGIGGATAAAHAGTIAALGALAGLGRIDEAERDRRAAPARRAWAAELRARPFLDTAYPPAPETLNPADDTIVCRCEEVTAGTIRGYARLGCLGPNQAKAFGRTGMGPCQGRYCGLTVTEILSAANATEPETTGYYRIRAPFKPVTLGELAGLADENPGARGARPHVQSPSRKAIP